jgi:Transposase
LVTRPIAIARHWVRTVLVLDQSNIRESVKEKKVQKRYDEEFKRQAVELVNHSGKTQAQIARELGVSEYSLTLWKKDYSWSLANC